MGKRILVVDGENIGWHVLQQALETAGYEVLCIGDGDQALQSVTEGTPDLVLLEMQLPGKDGIEVLSHLRRHHPALPIVVLTAHGTVETAVEALKLGAADYLCKPLSPDETRVLVTKALAQLGPLTDRPADGKAAILEAAKLLLQQRRFNEAEQILHGALAKDPADPQVFNLLGVALEFKGMLQEASQFYRAALSFRPGFTRAQQNLRRVTAWPYFSKGLSAELNPEVENGIE